MNEQVILDFVTNWRASQGIPADGSALTQAQLREFAVDVSGQVQQLSVRPRRNWGQILINPQTNEVVAFYKAVAIK